MRLVHLSTVVAALGSGVFMAAVGTDAQPWTPVGISSPQFESHAAFDPRTGDLYFVRSSPQFSGWRILFSRCTGRGWSTPEPPAFAGDGVEADPYETRKTPAGWAPRTKLGPEVNQNGTEIGPLFSPSGRSLLFARDTKGPDSGEFFVWYEHGREAWPPDCAGRGR